MASAVQIYNFYVANRAYGNVGRAFTYYVDQTMGADITGAVNGPPFLTLNAAVTAANASNTICLIKLSPGTYVGNASSTIGWSLGSNVSMSGSGINQTMLLHNLTGPGTTLTVNTGCQIADMSVTTTTSNGTGNVVAVQVLGDNTDRLVMKNILVSASQNVTATATTNVIGTLFSLNPGNQPRILNVKTAAASAANILTNCFGSQFTTSSTSSNATPSMRYLTSSSTATGTGNAVGSIFAVNVTPGFLDCTFTGANVDLASTGTNATALVKHCTFSNNKMAGPILTPLTSVSKFDFSVNGAMILGNQFAVPGNAAGSSNEVFLTMNFPTSVVNFTFSITIPAGLSVFTVTATVRKNSINTAFAASVSNISLLLAPTQFSATSAAFPAVQFNAGDKMSVIVNSTISIGAPVFNSIVYVL